jgi:hypothetical protein
VLVLWHITCHGNQLQCIVITISYTELSLITILMTNILFVCILPKKYIFFYYYNSYEVTLVTYQSAMINFKGSLEKTTARILCYWQICWVVNVGIWRIVMSDNEWHRKHLKEKFKFQIMSRPSHIIMIFNFYHVQDVRWQLEKMLEIHFFPIA